MDKEDKEEDDEEEEEEEEEDYVRGDRRRYRRGIAVRIVAGASESVAALCVIALTRTGAPDALAVTALDTRVLG